jgi:hypothetical protein
LEDVLGLGIPTRKSVKERMVKRMVSIEGATLSKERINKSNVF